MSEFARQPHPDAAHMERLAREIPGLTPSQVQVWFQDRYGGTLLQFSRNYCIHFSDNRRAMSVGVPVTPEHRLSIEEGQQEERRNKCHRQVLNVKVKADHVNQCRRLTHHETRFLLSEFARQPHPDAAHLERLAREIPGLTPRQVQVWFQNRYGGTLLQPSSSFSIHF